MSSYLETIFYYENQVFYFAEKFLLNHYFKNHINIYAITFN